MATYYVRSAGGNDFSGTAITDGAYTNSTKTLAKTGIGTGLTAGMKIAISGGTNMTPGLYVISTVAADSLVLAGTPGSDDSADVAVPSNAGTSFAAGFATTYKAAAVATGPSDVMVLCADAAHTNALTTTFPANTATAASPITVTGANATGTVDGTKASISITAAVFAFTNGVNIVLRHLSVASHATRDLTTTATQCIFEDIENTGRGFATASVRCMFLRCKQTSGSYFTDNSSLSDHLVFVDCLATGCSTRGFENGGGRGGTTFVRCRATSCVIGFDLTQGSATQYTTLIDCIADSNTTSAINYSGGGGLAVSGCTIDGNGVGIAVADANGTLLVTGSVIQHNTTGISLASARTSPAMLELNNVYYNNTTDMANGTISSTSSTGTDPGLIRTGGDFGHDGDTVLTEVEYTLLDAVNKTYLYAGASQPKTITPAEVAAAAWSDVESPSRTLTA